MAVIERGSGTAASRPSRKRWPVGINGQAFLGRLAIIVGLLAIWEVLAQTKVVDKEFVSTPIDVARAIGRILTDHTALSAFAYTGGEIAIAFVLGTTCGLLAGAALGLSALLRDALLAPLNFLLSTPKSVFLPIFILYFGIGTDSAAAYGAFSAFVFVAVNVVGGVGLVQQKLLTMGRAYGANTRQRLTEIVFPSAMPGVFAALWQGIHHALGGVLIVELFASSNGIGQLIQQYTNNFQSDNALAVAVIISVLAIAVASLWSALERRLSRWRTQSWS
ncbi:MAG: hypothetical protein QOI26_150 [Pseudonocardiales bacterium]|nr:hypothetical protein [Pseudonocardiales bacterium]